MEEEKEQVLEAEDEEDKVLKRLRASYYISKNKRLDVNRALQNFKNGLGLPGFPAFFTEDAEDNQGRIKSNDYLRFASQVGYVD